MQFDTFDAAYVEKLRSGDLRTEEHFVTYFGKLIQLKLRSRLNSKEAIEDVRQETFVRVLASLRSPKGLRQPERLGAFVNSVCNNVLLEHYRSRDRSDSLDDEDEPSFASCEASALSLVLTKDTKRVVGIVLDKLTDRDRRLLRGVFLEERDKDEVCREFGVDREYMRVLLHRAKQSFKTMYLKTLGAGKPY